MANPILIPADGEATILVTKRDGTTESYKLTSPPGHGAMVLQPVDTTTGAHNVLSLVSWGLALLLIFGVGTVFLYRLVKGQISLVGLIAEDNGTKASLSRFQALVFTFVVAIGIVLILFDTHSFPTSIPLELLALLAGSLGTYLASKSIGSTPAAGDNKPTGAGNPGWSGGPDQTPPTR